MNDDTTTTVGAEGEDARERPWEPPLDRLMTFTDLMHYLGLGERTLRRHLREGKIKCFLVGNSYRFYREDVDEYVRSGRSNSTNRPNPTGREQADTEETEEVDDDGR